MKRLSLFALSVTLTSLLAGCMVTGQDPSQSGSSTRLRLALNFTPIAELSPYTDDAVSLTRMGVAEPLITIDPNGEPQPALAEKFEMTDAKTATFTLRSGVKFHDGTEVTAQNVAASIQHAIDATPAPASVSGRQLSVSAEGTSTVVVKAPSADPLLAMRFANPDLVILAPKAYEADPNKPSAVDAGTGAFEMTKLSGTEATLEANPSYWAGTPKLAGLDVKFIGKADARVSSLRAGELDVVQNVPIAQLPNLEDNMVESRPIPRTTGLYLNTKGPVFGEVGIRAAAAKAIDKAAIASSVFEGHADVADGLFRGDTDWAKNRPAPALPEAGNPSGKTITLATYDDRPELPEAATIVADQLRKAGFTVAEPVVKPYSVLEPEIMAGKYDVVLASRMYLSKASDPLSLIESDYGCKGTYNLSFLCDKALDAVVAKHAGATETSARLRGAVEAESAMLGTAAYVPLVHEQLRLGRVPGVSGIAEDPLEWRIVTHETTIAR